MKKLPQVCPSCESRLTVKSLICENCRTEINGMFKIPLLGDLNADDQKFILEFVKCSGSLKVMAQQMDLSYPTMRNMLDDLIARIEKLEKDNESKA